MNDNIIREPLVLIEKLDLSQENPISEYLELVRNALLTFDPIVKLCCHDLQSLVLWMIGFTESDAACPLT